MAYSKLYSSLVSSSLWAQDDPTRLLFITLLALADRDGMIYGSKMGIGRIANIDPDNIDEAFAVLSSPDPESSDLMRAPENEGRRIEEAPGGWRLLNYKYYRGLRNEDDRREQNAEAQRRFREKKVSPGKPRSAKISRPKPPSSQAEAEGEAEADVKKEGEKEGAVVSGPPTLEQAIAYFKAEGLKGNPKAFFDHQEAYGWRGKKGPIKNWKAAARTWSNNEGAFGGPAPRQHQTPGRYSEVQSKEVKS